MGPLICEVTEDLLALYLEGDIQDKTREEIEEHLKICPKCRKQLETFKKETGKVKDILAASEMPKEKLNHGKKVIRKAGNRLKLFWASFILLYLLINIVAVSLIFRQADESKKALILTTELTNPGMSVNVIGQGMSSPFTGKISVTAERSLSRISLTKQASYSLRGRLHLVSVEGTNELPFPIFPDRPHPANAIQKEREALERLPEGSVAEAVISFNDFLSPEEVDSFLQNKNIRSEWFAFHAEGPSHDSQDDGVTIEPYRLTLGFPLWSTTSLDTDRNNIKGDVARRSATFKEDLIWLGKRYNKVKGIMYFPPVDKIANYVEKNGIKIYAIVVTGSAEDIKQLLKEELVRSVQLGEIVFRR